MAGKKKGDKKKEPEASNPNEERKRSEKELILQKQLDELTTESTTLRDTLEQLRRDSHFLRGQIDSSVEEHTDYRVVLLKISYFGVKPSSEVIFGSKNVILGRFWVKTCDFRSFLA